MEQLSSLGARRAFVVVDPALAKAEGLVRITEELEKSGAAVEIAADVQHPQRVDAVRRLADRLRSWGPDWIVAMGGGATIDAAKGARLLFERPEFVLEPPSPIVAFPENPTSRLVAVPTTSGSGAEASWTVDLIADEGVPIELAHRALVPEWALVDPAFARGLPPAQLLAGGLATAATATEAFVSAWANPFSDALAVGAVVAVVRNLTHALRWPDEPESRAALHYAATAAGLAASNAQRGVAHALARALAGPTGLSYPVLLGLVLPSVLEFDRPSARDRLETLAVATAHPDESSAVDLATRLRRLGLSLGAPRDLGAAGVPAATIRDARAKIVATALRSPGTVANPRVPTPDDLGRLVDGLIGSGPG